jgi:hypothetical protein
MADAAFSGLRRAVVVGVGALIVLGAFIVFHSGSQASALCERERFVSGGSLSFWPPGARCTYGLPLTSDTVVNPLFVLIGGAVLITIVLLLVPSARGARPSSPVSDGRAPGSHDPV